ncbi:molybdopterin cofactor-binding domain-containing protein [Mucilaginibacter paludis]|uniref:Aldehyde oxidase and xanthine dehydrogenase molybdopterin binding n=1 Tax=Mucilaginibacter paludis DSM 18603 TaxID=714943 RepID=H1Y461_9SPHI|nr:molybdopterin cofactor-binding domain-containing protein [Mucilaginibacter paludis]EHQ24797.1 aldehyde oxidase and xanthine dehydrogenase molybdopterin binding [Mucilaginibacter paludis DSM 18603]
MSKSNVVFVLNGERVEVTNVHPKDLLIDYLRSPEINLTGTKLSCGEGGCGACTVLWSHYDFEFDRIIDVPVNSCLRPLCSLDGTAVSTIEYLSPIPACASIETNMVKKCGSQCGYCSPGFVTTMFGLLRKDPSPDSQAVEDQFAGNICRCTGYISILNAMHETAEAADPVKGTGIGTAELNLNKDHFHAPVRLEISKDQDKWFRPLSVKEVFQLLKVNQPVLGKVKIVQGNTSIGIYKSDVEDPKVFIDVSALPEWKKITLKHDGLHLSGGVTINELLEYLNRLLENSLPNYNGFSALAKHIKGIAGVQVRSAASVAGSLMMVKNHEGSTKPFPGDLFTVFLMLGAKIEYITSDLKKQSVLVNEFPLLTELSDGFLITGILIPYSDPAEIVYTYRVARRTQNSHPIVNAAFRCKVKEDKTIKSLKIVYGGIATVAKEFEKVEGAVLSDSSLVWDKDMLAKVLPALEDEADEYMADIDDIGISTLYKRKLVTNLFYKFFVFVTEQLKMDPPCENLSALDKARPIAAGSHQPFPSAFFQGVVVQPTSAFASFLQPASMKIANAPILDHLTLSGVPSAQVINIQAKTTPIGKDSPFKIDSKPQLNGQAKYTHDLSVSADTLSSFYVYSTNRNAEFIYKDGLNVLKTLLKNEFPDVHYITKDDIPHPDPDNDQFDPNYPGYYDPIFADGVVTCFGQPIGIVVSADLRTAKAAAEFIQTQIEYGKEPIKTIASMQSARDNNSQLIQKPGKFDQGMATIFRHVVTDSPSAKEEILDWLNAPKSLSEGVFVNGRQQTGAQYHFYMEPQGALAIPREDGQLEVYASTQNQASCQKRISLALNKPLHDVKVGTTRLGGGFGGKELRQVYVAVAASVAANKLNKPVRLLLNRNVDMRMQGLRHPFDGTYSVVAHDDGKITRMRVDYEADGGISFDCSYPVMDLALLCAENAYFIPVFKTTGKVYRTNFQSRTAFRSFGLVQSMLITETAVEHMAFILKIRPEVVREKNFYEDGLVDRLPQVTPYGSKLVYNRINQVWNNFKKTINFDDRVKLVDTFNQKNKWKKRGISMVPLKYGISYTYRPMNQGSAYIMVYNLDGSALLHHGGVEMGQGINTKMAQIAAIELGIDIEMIRIGGTNTSIIPNVSSTGASTGSDLNGGAVKKACRILKQNMLDFIKDSDSDFGKSSNRKYPDVTDDQILFMRKINSENWSANWKKLVGIMNTARQDLSAQYSFGSPNLGKVKSTPDGNNQIDNPDSQVFYYYNNCVAASEVEVDVLTGKFEIIQSDIVFDAGNSLNDYIDLGQIEGGFIQGVGCLTTEEMLYAEDGRIISDGTWEYKPPCSKTIPQQFNVYLLKYYGTDNRMDPLQDTYGINSSKSTGEPPLVLANTVFFAIRHAIAEARKDQRITDWFELSAPATVEKIQNACGYNAENILK